MVKPTQHFMHSIDSGKIQRLSPIEVGVNKNRPENKGTLNAALRRTAKASRHVDDWAWRLASCNGSQPVTQRPPSRSVTLVDRVMNVVSVARRENM
jgi:hypothetical protein